MFDKLTDNLKTYTLLSLAVEILIFNLPSIIDGKVSLDILENVNSIIVLLSLVGSILLYKLLLDNYESIIQILFRKPMLELALAKKVYKNGKYNVEGRPLKSYEKLPIAKKNEIDKVDNDFDSYYMPNFLDTIVAWLNTIIILSYCIIIGTYVYLFIGLIVVFIVSLIIVKWYNKIEYVISVDMKSLFEG